MTLGNDGALRRAARRGDLEGHHEMAVCTLWGRTPCCVGTGSQRHAGGIGADQPELEQQQQ
jgi:hypothetical protein